MESSRKPGQAPLRSTHHGRSRSFDGASALAAIGFSVFQGVDELYEFAMGTYRAGTTRDLDVAAGHFAKAVIILGIRAVLAVLLRGAPRTYRGDLEAKGPPTGSSEGGSHT